MCNKPLDARSPLTPPPIASLRVRSATLPILMLGVLGVTLVFAVATGPVQLQPREVAGALIAPLLGQSGDGNTANLLVTTIRLPRVLLAALVGAALAVAGAVMQALFRNPLAEPGITGVSSGAAAAAVVAIVSGLSALAWWTLPLSAFIGALAATAVVHVVSGASRGRTSTIILVGIAVNALLGAVVAAVLANAPEAGDVQRVMFWLNGDLTASTWSDVSIAALGIPLGILVLFATAGALDLFSISETQAASTGVNVVLTRQIALGAAALITATAVSVTGVISFVGLVVPHLVRLVFGPQHGRLLVLSAVVGAIFLVLADLLARMLFYPITLQTGTVTAFVGAPVLLLLVLRKKAGQG